MQKLLRRIQYWFRARQAETDLTEELELHRALTQDRFERNGVPRGEAASLSRRELGNITLAREDARRVWVASWLESVWQDAAYALRMITRAPGFALSMIVVTALGIGAATGVFSLIDGLILRTLPVRDADRLAYLSRPSFSYPVFTELRARGSHIFSELFAWNLEGVHVQWTTELERAEVLMASGNFYSTLGIQASLGRTFTSADDQIGGGPDGMVAVISHACWTRRLGGDPATVGRTVRIDGKPFTIIGVAPRGFSGVAPGLAPEITIPLTVLQNPEALGATTSAWVHLMGRLRDGLSLERANAALQGIWPTVLQVTTHPGMAPDRRALYLGRTTTLESGQAGYSRVRNQFQEPLWLLLALVFLLLSVATASTANLLVARGVARRREFAVRLAIGAGRPRVVRQILTEALVWTLLGAAGGLLVASWGSNTLVGMMTTWENPISLEVDPTWRVVSFALVLSFLTAAASAVFPALRSTRLNTRSPLKEFGQVEGSATGSWAIGRLLVITQVALTVLLLFGASLFVRSLQRILAQDAGFERDALLVVSTDAMAAGYRDVRLMDFYARLLDRVKAIPGVESASVSLYPPISDEDGAWTQSIGVDGGPLQRDLTRQVHFNAVTPGYLHTTGMRLLRGRDFTDGDHAPSQSVVIISESLARQFFRGEDPLGHRIAIGRDESRRDLEVIGVVRDAKYQRLQEPARSIALLPMAQHPDRVADEDLFAEVRVGGRSARVMEAIRLEIRALNSAVPIRVQTVHDRIRDSLVTERVIASLATTLGLSALVLACAGLYGLLAYTVSRQTNEIGLRLALGADRSRVLRMVLRQSLVLGIIGVACGAGASMALGQFARNALFQVSATDPLALGAAGGIMLAVALCAGFFPARRASRVDPVVALRSE